MKNAFDTIDKFQLTVSNNYFIIGLVIGAMLAFMLIIFSHAFYNNRKGGKQ